MKYSYYTVIGLFLVAVCLVVPSAARGGRGRGGGSFGGIFGGWRSKYGSKSSSSGGGRRVLNGSPVHTAMTVPKLPPPPPAPPKPMSMPKPQMGNYPRQQLPPGYSYGTGAGQGTFYSNAQAMPSGALYYPQPPMGMSMGSGANGFLTGMLAGRLMDGMLYGRRHHGSHVYHQNQNQNQPGETTASSSNSGRQIIVINNGQSQPGGEGAAESDQFQLYDELRTQKGPLSEEEPEQEELSSEEEMASTLAPQESLTAPDDRIVCFPIMLNETDPQSSQVVREVERIICFPASSMNPNVGDCQNDPQCSSTSSSTSSSTTSTEPPIVAGDIGGETDVAEYGEEAGVGDEDTEKIENAEEATSTMANIDTAQN